MRVRCGGDCWCVVLCSVLIKDLDLTIDVCADQMDVDVESVDGNKM
jgi:hypothetical protein